MMGLPTRINIGPLFLFGVEGVVLQITFYLIALQGCIILVSDVYKNQLIVLLSANRILTQDHCRFVTLKMNE